MEHADAADAIEAAAKGEPSERQQRFLAEYRHAHPPSAPLAAADFDRWLAALEAGWAQSLGPAPWCGARA